MSNISPNIGSDSGSGGGSGGVETVDTIPSTGSDGDLIKFRGIMFRWDNDLGDDGAWLPLPKHQWQTFEDWSTGDLTHWALARQDAGISYSVNKGNYLEVDADANAGAFVLHFASQNVQVRKAIELRMKLQKRSPRPGSGAGLARYLFKKESGSGSVEYANCKNSEFDDYLEVRLDDDNGDRDKSGSETWDWPQDSDHYFHVGLTHRAGPEELTGWGEIYDSNQTLQVSDVGTATPVPDLVNFFVNFTVSTDADIRQIFRIYSMSMRAIG